MGWGGGGWLLNKRKITAWWNESTRARKHIPKCLSVRSQLALRGTAPSADPGLCSLMLCDLSCYPELFLQQKGCFLMHEAIPTTGSSLGEHSGTCCCYRFTWHISEEELRFKKCTQRPWIAVRVRLSSFTVHLQLSQHHLFIGCIPI